MKKFARLNPDITPIRYTLELAPDLEAFTFLGQETITIELTKGAETITLHARDIDITSARIEYKNHTSYAKVSYNKRAETATFTFDTEIKKGTVELNLAFQGIISDSLRGFYRSKYVLDGKTKHLATTQFEATDARRAFPCFDEPAHKAIFDVSIVVPTTHTAISNTMPISIREHRAGYKIVEFSSTPRMSTYLLAFIIGEFEYVEAYTKDKKTQVRVFTTAGKSHQAQFALEVATKCIEFYNTYFDIPYPLPVLDMIAIPDFESAAMENWGAITYRESAILFDEAHSSLSNKQWVATVIAHEIAHQWFGNLVTMHWWTDLWLNEGFAEFIPILCLDHIFPKWNMHETHVVDGRLAVAMKLDSLTHSHPIQVEVHHPDEIGEVFDMISYAKGAAIIRQLETYLGHDIFRDGLRHYLKTHSYKNTETKHLWESFEIVSKKPVGKIMESWTTEMGYPLVTIEKKKNGYLARQERFFSSRISARKNKTRTIWQIPLIYKNGSQIVKTLMNKKEFPLAGARLGKVNVGEISFMRVRYDQTTHELLKTQIEKGTLSTIDRLGIIRDLFALAEGGYVSTDEMLEFSLAYKKEKEYVVWAEIAAGINKLYNYTIIDAKSREKYGRYVRSLFSPQAIKVSWKKKKGEDNSQTLLRSLVLAQAGMYGDGKVIAHAQALFTNRDKKPIEADIRSVVYGIVAQNGGTKEWDTFKKLYLSQEMHEEKDRYARALTQFRDKTLLAKTLMFILSNAVRDQDAPHLLAAVWSNLYGRDLAWAFIKHNWPIILKRYGHGGHFLSRLLSPLALHTTKEDITDAKKFFKKNAAPGTERVLKQSYERIAGNAAWIKDDQKKIEEWLDKNFN